MARAKLARDFRTAQNVQDAFVDTDDMMKRAGSIVARLGKRLFEAIAGRRRSGQFRAGPHWALRGFREPSARAVRTTVASLAPAGWAICADGTQQHCLLLIDKETGRSLFSGCGPSGAARI